MQARDTPSRAINWISLLESKPEIGKRIAQTRNSGVDRNNPEVSQSRFHPPFCVAQVGETKEAGRATATGRLGCTRIQGGVRRSRTRRAEFNGFAVERKA